MTMSTNGTMNTIRLPQPTGLDSLPPLPVHDITSSASAEKSDDRLQTLSKVLAASHDRLAPLREPELILHSHMPHIIGSSYYLGASAQQIHDTYEAVLKTLNRKDDDQFLHGPEAKIKKATYKDQIYKKEYSVAYVDFFDEEFRKADGDWQSVVEKYVFGDDGPLMTGLIGGLAHPLIHLHYAYEYNCASIASEGMSLLCTEYFPDPALLEDPPQAALCTPVAKTKSLASLLEAVHHDARFDNLFEHPGIGNMDILLADHREAIAEHYGTWIVGDNPTEQLEHICDVATLIAIGTGNAERSFDFFLIHTMTSAHALRFVWDRIPPKQRPQILRAYVLLVVLVYIDQLRPSLKDAHADIAEKVDIQGRDWTWVNETAVSHPAKYDVHFFKVVRAPEVFAETWGEKNGFYLKAAIKFLDEFTGFEGFAPVEEGEFNPRFEGWQAPWKL